MNGEFEMSLQQLVKNAVRDVIAEFKDEVRTLIAHQVPRVTATADVSLLTPRETAKRLAISERHLFELTRTGQLHCVRVGRNVRYSVDTIRKWVWDTASPTLPPIAEKDDRLRERTEPAAPTSLRGAPRLTAGRSNRRPLVGTATASNTRLPTTRQPTSKGKRQESGEQISPLTVLFSEMGIDRNKLTAITNGELMRIAEVDISMLHGWQYLNRPLPDEAIRKLKNHFRCSVAERRNGV